MCSHEIGVYAPCRCKAYDTGIQTCFWKKVGLCPRITLARRTLDTEIPCTNPKCPKPPHMWNAKGVFVGESGAAGRAAGNGERNEVDDDEGVKEGRGGSEGAVGSGRPAL